MIVIEYIDPKTSSLVHRNLTATSRHVQVLEQFNEPIIVDADLINTDMCVYICSPSAMECKKLDPSEFQVVDNAIVLLPSLLRRFTFLPGSQVIITKQPQELQVSKSASEYNFVLLVKSVEQRLERVKIRPRVALSTFERYVSCSLVDENGNEYEELELPFLDEQGVAVTVKIKIKSTLFEKIMSGDYPAVDLEIEYYQ
ncbi:MAG: hypothetical protein QXE80_03300 [Pyrobaculum sp.]